ncbi:MAG: patatin-like phospholipase family protein [Anaerolineae bacterium]|nr:patatin-like phospholipase family protein [Anaerolineae bacterium]
MDTGSQLGLALGGGGARGGAHIGLLKVLDEAGVRVGAIAGTSAGGVVGGLYAAGLSGAEIESLLTSVDPAAVLEPDASGWALLSTRRFLDLVRSWVGDPIIEDLPHPFATVAVDLRNSREVHFASGPLVAAMQATIALPGILCPLDAEGSLCVDGGVLNNVPVDVARKLGARRVVAVDVSTPFDCPLEMTTLAGLPGPVRIAERLLTVARRRQAARALIKSWNMLAAAYTARRLQDNPPDLLLRPDLGAMPVTAMQQLRTAIAVGERVAREHLEEIRRLASE